MKKLVSDMLENGRRQRRSQSWYCLSTSMMAQKAKLVMDNKSNCDGLLEAFLAGTFLRQEHPTNRNRLARSLTIVLEFRGMNSN